MLLFHSCVKSTVPGHPIFPVTHLPHGLQEQAMIPRLRCCCQDDLAFFQEIQSFHPVL